uniref:Uncharacterized protein n=1 Tax=Arundo donax TaxID=35708 RepID=A0A0A9AQQ2_ARUDO
MSSRSYAASLACCGATAQLKYAKGPPRWCSTAPKPVPEASQSTTNGRSKSGSCKTGPSVSARFNAVNACSAAGVQRKASFFSSWVRGRATVP